MDSTHILVDRLVDEIMKAEDLSPFEPFELAELLLTELERIWNDVPEVTHFMISSVAAALKQHHADGIAEQLLDRMKR